MSEGGAGVVVIVWRRSPELQVLLLHRSRFGVDFAGEWAWTTPGGGLGVGEHPQAAAQRELREETGLSLACEAVSSAIAEERRGIEVSVFAAEARDTAEIRLSDEHDRYEWVRPGELTRCLPDWVHAMYVEVLGGLDLPENNTQIT